MRILHLSDTHLGAHLNTTGHPPGWHRSHDHLRALRQALQPALAGDVGLVVHTGDVFDRSQPPPAVCAAAQHVFAEAARRLPVVLVRGNHDRRGLARSLARVPGLHLVDRPERLVVAGIAIAAIPHMRSAADWAAAARVLCERGADLVAAHNGFDGARVPGLTFRVGHPEETVGVEHLPPAVRWVLCGHIHPRQVLRLGHATVVMPGPTERTAFSESSEPKGVALWELGRQVSWRFVDLPTRQMLVVRTRRDLERVREGALVSFGRSDPPRPWVDQTLARRAIVVGPTSPEAPTRQLELFA